MAASAAARLASAAAAKASAIDAKYDLSSKAHDAKADLSAKVKGKAQSAHTAIAKKIHSTTPEERERWAAGAVVTAQVLSIVGGRKTRALAGSAAAVAALSKTASNHHHQQQQQPSGFAGAPATAPAAFSDGSGITEMVLLEVIATSPAGQLMLVHVDGLGDFEVSSPFHSAAFSAAAKPFHSS